MKIRKGFRAETQSLNSENYQIYFNSLVGDFVKLKHLCVGSFINSIRMSENKFQWLRYLKWEIIFGLFRDEYSLYF
jgi:hypothetical protein